jgi:hypothetical protein
MEPARRLRPEDEAPAPEIKVTAEPETASEGIEKVLRFAMPLKGAETGVSGRPNTPMTARDFAAALDIVREAADAVKAADARAREAETRTHTVAQRAAEELKAAEARILAADARVRAAEARAQEAESRAAEADGWVRQIFTTISDELPVRRPA